MHQSTENFDLPKSAKPPDGGWGWVVTFSAFMISVLFDGINLTFGVFFSEYLCYFQESKGKTLMLQSVLVGTMFVTGNFVPFNLLSVMAGGLNLSTSESSLLISVIGISNTVTRILVGYIADKTWADSMLINNIALIAGGVATLFVPFYGGFGTLAAYSVLFGASVAVFITLRTIIVADLLGIEKLSRSYGLTSLSMGITSIAGSPVAGDYDIAFYFAGITMGLAGVIGLPLRRIAKWEINRYVDTRCTNKRQTSKSPTSTRYQ